jgi:acetyl esterase/lipase
VLRARHSLALCLTLACPAAAATDADTAAIPIWSKAPPGSERRAGEAEQLEAGVYVHNVHRPSVTVSRPDARRANGAAIIIVPGGGHRMLVFQNEGMAPARALNRFGITTFVLKYRLAREAGSTYTIEANAVADAKRAIRWVRAHAKDYGVDPHRVGIMGFSAGGELVSLLADNPQPNVAAPADAIDRQSARPDFQILVYPGPLGIPARSVAGAPPAFIAAGSLDRCCAPPALTLYTQLREAGVSAELHMFAGTDHGFNVAVHNDRVSIQHWPDRLADWLSDEGWLSAGH